MVGFREGGCQCGSIRYRITGEPIGLCVCHCTECQRQSGSAFGMSLNVRSDEFVLLSGELHDFVRTAESGKRLRCSFCPQCGTRIHHRSTDVVSVLSVKPGTLDDRSWLVPTLHVWTRGKHGWVPVPEDVESFEQEPD